MRIINASYLDVKGAFYKEIFQSYIWWCSMSHYIM